MELSAALDLGRDTLLLSLVIAGPILAIGLAIGLLISILQAVTQLQEQTIVFVPKMVAMILATVLLLPWIAQRLLDYSREMLGRVPWQG
jgi:flagellar biosynthetic protein FliQ